MKAELDKLYQVVSLETLDRFEKYEGQKYPMDPRRDFTLHGEFRGQKVWYRWNHGEITTNHPKTFDWIRELIQEAPEIAVSARNENGSFIGRYQYKNVFVDPLSFRMVLQDYGLNKLERIEGDAPVPPPPSFFQLI